MFHPSLNHSRRSVMRSTSCCTISIFKSSYSTQQNPYIKTLRSIDTPTGKKNFFSFDALADPRVKNLPFSIRALLESAVRNCDDFSVTQSDVNNILNWEKTSTEGCDVPYKPSRVVMQDMSGGPCLMDLAAMRDAVERLGGNADAVNPLCPVALVIDHSVIADQCGSAAALDFNMEIEFERNRERFSLMKWGSQAFRNLKILPPGSGIVHQLNLEYLANVVFDDNDLLYLDGVVGTDSHTTMINGLGVCGWGVGGIEALSVMLGQPIVMQLPQVVGVCLEGKLSSGTTATDLVLHITQLLREQNVVGKFVEFYGSGVSSLPLADRATVANMAPEYGATMGYFPVDECTLKYLVQTGRDPTTVSTARQYLIENHLLTDFTRDEKCIYSENIHVDLNTIYPSLAGPKRPQDKVLLSDIKDDFLSCLRNEVGFKGYGIAEDELSENISIQMNPNGKVKETALKHGSVVVSSITSCTNTSNPAVILAAGLLAKNAAKKGLRVPPYVKTSFSPGSKVVAAYLNESGLQHYLDQLGFQVAGFGCMTCVGNSGDLDPVVQTTITDNNLVTAAVISGNRNFESRVHPSVRANYLASPPLAVAMALSGRVDINMDIEPLGVGSDGQNVYLRDIWPTVEDISSLEETLIRPDTFQEIYKTIEKGDRRWEKLSAPSGSLYEYDSSSTYIQSPPFLQGVTADPPSFDTQRKIQSSRCLLLLGDSITTDHISPVARIPLDSNAGRYLASLNVEVQQFGSYGTRRGNADVMTRGTFANTRLINQLVDSVGPITKHMPSGIVDDIYDVAMRYKEEDVPLIVIAGSDYGAGSARDWAAKGTALLGVKAVLANSFERIHRSNLVGMGVIPMAFEHGQDAMSLGLVGNEEFTIILPPDLKPMQKISIQVLDTTGQQSQFDVILRLDTEVEIEYFKHGGIMPYVMRQLIASNTPATTSPEKKKVTQESA